MNEILMRALLQTAAFLELSSDEVVDPNAALAALEDIAYLLRQLSAAEKETLIAFVRAEAEAAEVARVSELPSRLLGGDAWHRLTLGPSSGPVFRNDARRRRRLILVRLAQAVGRARGLPVAA